MKAYQIAINEVDCFLSGINPAKNTKISKDQPSKLEKKNCKWDLLTIISISYFYNSHYTSYAASN